MSQKIPVNLTEAPRAIDWCLENIQHGFNVIVNTKDDIHIFINDEFERVIFKSYLTAIEYAVKVDV